MLTILYITAVALGIGLVLYIWIVFFKDFKNIGSKKSLDKAMVRTKWLEIEASLNSGSTQAMNHAIMEADKLFDHALKSVVGTEGTMADRLKKAQNKFSSRDIYQDVWEAHKVRNRLAHEVHAEIFSLESKRTLEKFKKGLKDLHIL